MNYFRLLMNIIVSYANNECFISLILVNFISFPWLTALAMASHTILSRSGNNSVHTFFPLLDSKVSIFQD